MLLDRCAKRTGKIGRDLEELAAEVSGRVMNKPDVAGVAYMLQDSMYVQL